MRWFKNFFWLAAWSLWLWLGFGLHRELPRDLGPVVCQFELAEDETLLGFAPGREVVVVLRQPNVGERVFQFRDARTGAVLADETLTIRDRFTKSSTEHLVERAYESTPQIESADRHTILDLEVQTLREAGVGRVIYSGGGKGFLLGPSGPFEVSVAPELVPLAGARRFGVMEFWTISVGTWSTTPQTFSLRSMSDARMVGRLWERPLVCSSAGELCVDGDNNFQKVYELLPRANYPLLALCHSILALPLVLLWAFLRWRRIRRHRLANVQP